MGLDFSVDNLAEMNPWFSEKKLNGFMSEIVKKFGNIHNFYKVSSELGIPLLLGSIEKCKFNQMPQCFICSRKTDNLADMEKHLLNKHKFTDLNIKEYVTGLLDKHSESVILEKGYTESDLENYTTAMSEFCILIWAVTDFNKLCVCKKCGFLNNCGAFLTIK